MAFHIGQRVTPIETFTFSPYGELLPVAGRVYTIRAIRDFDHPLATGTGLVLVEIRNTPQNYATGFHEAHFNVRRFRPVVERKTDISIFTAMLNPSHVTVDAMKIADVAREVAQ